MTRHGVARRRRRRQHQTSGGCRAGCRDRACRRARRARARMPERPAPSQPPPPTPSSSTCSRSCCGSLASVTRQVRGARVADDVGDRLAQGERQRRSCSVVERQRLGTSATSVDAGGVERGPGRRELRLEPLAAIAVDRLADFGERIARDALDVADLAQRPAGVAVAELGRELRLQHDDRERVAEQVVEIARDALALGDRREVLAASCALISARSFRRISQKWMFEPPTRIEMTKAGIEKAGVRSSATVSTRTMAEDHQQPSHRHAPAGRRRRGTRRRR